MVIAQRRLTGWTTHEKRGTRAGGQELHRDHEMALRDTSRIYLELSKMFLTVEEKLGPREVGKPD